VAVAWRSARKTQVFQYISRVIAWFDERTVPIWRGLSVWREPAKDFLAHPLNWRIHPTLQQEALEDLLVSVGWVQGVIESARSGYLIDGHQRVLSALKQGDETLVPFVSVDLSDEEERLVLATFDPLATLTAPDDAKVSELLDGLTATSLTIASLLDGMRPAAERPKVPEQQQIEPAICPTCGQKVKVKRH
jgi:hypothetical protein